jgi:hypothetical protein
MNKTIKPNPPPRIGRLVREEINKSLDKWFQPGCGSRDTIINAFDIKWKEVSDKIRGYGGAYLLYKFQSCVPGEVENTIQRTKDLGWWKELTNDLIKSHKNEVDTELANEIITQSLTRWMRVDMQLWFPYEWEKIKDKKILDALNELSFDYGLGRAELSQIILLIEENQKWVQELLEDYISSGLIEYNKKETREAIADEVLLEFENFLEGEMGFLINSKRDEEDCETIILKFFKMWLVMDKRMWTGVKLEQVLMADPEKGELVFVDTISGQDHSEVKVR